MTRVDPADLRPHRRWYAVAVAVAVLGLLAAAAVLSVTIRAWSTGFPTLGSPFRGGESVEVDLRAGQPAVLYVSPDTATFNGRCTAELAGADVAVTEVSYTFTFFSGGRTWAARYEILADRDGRARLTCMPAAGTGGPLLATGDKPDNPRLLRGLAGSVAAGVSTALLGLVGGGVLALVIAKRRGSYRRRLQPPAVHDCGH
jgi:hypothetical protein